MNTMQDHAVEWWDPGIAVELLAKVGAGQAERGPSDALRFFEILAKAQRLEGLTLEEAAFLAAQEGPETQALIFRTAREVKETIYGPRIVLFAPLYLSNHCVNECTYCAFRAGHGLARSRLSPARIRGEVKSLLAQGQKRLLLVAGEDASAWNLRHLVEAIGEVYEVEHHRTRIRRVNVNIAPLGMEGFRALKAADIGTYQLFQESYDPARYAEVHLRGPKRDFAWRLGAMDRAMEAGIDDVGLGALLGLSDWKLELMGLLTHARHLEARFGCGPHTVSVPRLEPASGAAPMEASRVADADFLRFIAILRLALPCTGIILSTRERAEIRHAALALGVSQISAGSRTTVGGYDAEAPGDAGQFELGDHRSLAEVVRDLAAAGYVPSFCTACYRMGRTGADFMDLAKPGAIRHHCDPNALSSLQEYLADYGDAGTRELGEGLIRRRLAAMEDAPARLGARLVADVNAGERDRYV